MEPRREGLNRSASIPVACGLLAVGVALIAIFGMISLQENDVTALIRMSGGEPLAPIASELHEDFQFVHADAHYDGVYYFAIGIDPLAQGEAHDRIDHGAYHYSHPGFGWLAWFVSFGNPRWVPMALAFSGVFTFGAAAFAASLVARRHGLSEWGGLFVALSPGLIYAVTVDTSEPLGVLLLCLLALAWQARRWFFVAVLAMALCVTKEIFVVACAGIFLWRCVLAFRGDRKDLLASLGAISAGPTAFLLWQIYLYSRFEVFPYSEIPPSFYPPLQGWAIAITEAAGKSFSSVDSNQIGSIAVPLIIAVVALVLVGIYKATRYRSVYDSVFLMMGIMTLCMGPLQITYPKDLLRLTATQLVVVPLVLMWRSETVTTPREVLAGE